RQHIAERRVFDTRDEVSEQVGGVAVVERGSWLRDQWQGGESGDPLVGSHRTVDVAAEGTVEGLGEGTRPKGPVRQTRAMGEQVLEGDRSLRFIGLVEGACG